jgi:hypothetical protein
MEVQYLLLKRPKPEKGQPKTCAPSYFTKRYMFTSFTKRYIQTVPIGMQQYAMHACKNAD